MGVAVGPPLPQHTMKIALICLGLIALVAADGHGHGGRGRAVGHRAAHRAGRAGHRAAPARSVNRRRRGRQEAEAGSGSGADDAYGAPPAEEYGAPASEAEIPADTYEAAPAYEDARVSGDVSGAPAQEK